MSDILSFERVTFAYDLSHEDGAAVLRDCTFAVEKSDIAAVFGRSGAGKTTLFRLAAGLLVPTGGKIVRATDRIGYVFQEPRLLPWETVLANVSLPLRAAGIETGESRRRAVEWLDRVGLGAVAGRFPGVLSGGMVQRVSLARAFAVEPDLLLLDEPFGSLDPSLRDSLRDLLRDLLDRTHVAALVVSHYPEEVLGMATRVFTLDGGKIEEVQGEREEVEKRIGAVIG